VIGNGGFYDLKKISFINLVDCMFLAACGPPGGGRNFVTLRLFRFFNILWMPEITEKYLFQIYNNILFGFLRSSSKDMVS
jgi:dynein heavy chain